MELAVIQAPPQNNVLINVNEQPDTSESLCCRCFGRCVSFLKEDAIFFCVFNGVLFPSSYAIATDPRLDIGYKSFGMIGSVFVAVILGSSFQYMYDRYRHGASAD